MAGIPSGTSGRAWTFLHRNPKKVIFFMRTILTVSPPACLHAQQQEEKCFQQETCALLRTACITPHHGERCCFSGWSFNVHCENVSPPNLQYRRWNLLSRILCLYMLRWNIIQTRRHSCVARCSANHGCLPMVEWRNEIFVLLPDLLIKQMRSV